MSVASFGLSCIIIFDSFLAKILSTDESALFTLLLIYLPDLILKSFAVSLSFSLISIIELPTLSNSNPSTTRLSNATFPANLNIGFLIGLVPFCDVSGLTSVNLTFSKLIALTTSFLLRPVINP